MDSRESIQATMVRLDSFLDDFSAITHHAISVYRGYRPEVLIEHTPRSAASNIYDHIVAECERRFYGHKDVRSLDIRGLKLWLIGEDQHTVIRWKKMDEDGRSRNYPTKQAEDFDRMLDLPGLPPAPVRVSVGYVLDPSGTSVQRVQVARPNGRAVDWCAAIVPLERRGNDGRKWEDVSQQSRLAG
jgi:hypothetical protein